MKHEIYETDSGFGYRILSEDDVVLKSQEFDPETPGFNTMSEERAEFLASNYVLNYVAPVIVPVVKPKTDEQQRIEQLETENTDLKARLGSVEPRLADVEIALVDIYGGAI